MEKITLIKLPVILKQLVSRIRTGVFSIEGGFGETDVCSRSCLLQLLLVPCSTMASNKLRRILLLCLGLTTFILGNYLT